MQGFDINHQDLEKPVTATTMVGDYQSLHNCLCGHKICICDGILLDSLLNTEWGSAAGLEKPPVL